MGSSTDKADVFPPPAKPVECFCLHCRHVYMSDLMLPVVIDNETHYCCPTEGCTAMGWEFDIFPMVDDENASDHWTYDDEIDDDDLEESWSEDGLAESGSAGLLEGFNVFDGPSETFEPPREWTPEANLEEDELMDEDIDEAIYFTREDLDRLKQSGEVARRIEEIQNRWKTRNDEQSKSDACDHLWHGKEFKELRDEDIPF